VRCIRRTPSQLHSLQQIPTQHDMLPQHLVYKSEVNREYVITLARKDETPWWWSEKIETYRSGFKRFNWKLYRYICWLIVEVIQLFSSLFFVLILPKTSATSNIHILMLVLLATLTPSGWVLGAETRTICLKRAVCNPTVSIGWWVWLAVRTVHGTNDIESRSVVSKSILRP